MAASPEAATVQWARARAAISGLVGTRVATELPNDPALPFLVCTQVAGAPIPGEAPMGLWSIQFDCYGATKDSADSLQLAVIDAAEEINKSGTEGHVYGVVINSAFHADEPDAVDRHLYVVDAFVTLR